MSGGVDSSVAALLVAREGRVKGALTLRLSDASPEVAGEGRCCAASDVRDARRVADRLGLAHWVVDARTRFRRDVIAPFVAAYLEGRTPIPCVACNDRLKFEDLRERAFALGARRVATGHYARIERDGGRWRLLRAVDRSKDQSYFLHGLSQEQLGSAEFPLGALAKDEVRRLARDAGLATAAKPESQEICFVPDGDVASFVEREAAASGRELRPGRLVDLDGATRGEHAGVHRFTVGQRRGLGAHGAPMHVIELRPDSAEVVVGGPEALGFDAARVDVFNWIGGAPSAAVDCDVQVRHGRRAARGRITPVGTGVTVELATPERAIAPGQALVAYDGDVVIGGGPITSARRVGDARASREMAWA